MKAGERTPSSRLSAELASGEKDGFSQGLEVADLRLKGAPVCRRHQNGGPTRRPTILKQLFTLLVLNSALSQLQHIRQFWTDQTTGKLRQISLLADPILAGKWPTRRCNRIVAPKREQRERERETLASFSFARRRRCLPVGDRASSCRWRRRRSELHWRRPD